MTVLYADDVAPPCPPWSWLRPLYSILASVRGQTRTRTGEGVVCSGSNPHFSCGSRRGGRRRAPAAREAYVHLRGMQGRQSNAGNVSAEDPTLPAEQQAHLGKEETRSRKRTRSKARGTMAAPETGHS